MRIFISDKAKKDIFISLFQLLKAGSSFITIFFNKDFLHIQGMDKSHVCLFEIKITSTWFSEYEISENDVKNVCINSQTFHSILYMTQENDSINIHYENSPETIDIDLTNSKNEFNKYFRIPLSDLESDLLEIPDVDYSAEFSISSKKMNEIVAQLSIFGDIMNLRCNEEVVEIVSSGVDGEMKVNIPIDDLSEFSISEGESLDISYSLTYIQKMCVTTRLASEIEFSISPDMPLRIKYNIGDQSYVTFFIAPKIE
jgi:proliferating cell nuclear antigen